MRSLYEILESIVDKDSEVLANQYATVSLPVYIADIYHEIFGNVVEFNSKVTKIDKWFTLGFIDEDYIKIDVDDFKVTCKNMEKKVKEFKALFRQRAYIDKKTKVDIKIEKDNKLATWKANITISYEKYDYEICLILTDINNLVQYGMVWTTSEKLKQLL